MPAEKEVLKEKPEVEKAVNIDKIRIISKRQKKVHKGRMLAWIMALVVVIAVLFILSKTAIIKSAPIDNAILQNIPENETEPVQAVIPQEKSNLLQYSDKDFGISFSYPDDFTLGSYIGKDISLMAPKLEGSIQTTVKITKTPLSSRATLDDYVLGTKIGLGLRQFVPENITLSDGTDARLINVEIPRAANSRGVYLLVFVKQNVGYYFYYFAPIDDFRANLPKIENIAKTIKLES